MSHAPAAALERRHATIRSALVEQHLDALVVTSLPNVLYLSNFTGSSAIAILTADRFELLTDFRYLTVVNALQRELAALELTTVEGSYDAALVQRLLALPVKRIGIEAAHLTVARHSWLAASISRSATGNDGAELVPTEGIVERARLRKDDYEIDTLREAARRLSDVARAVLDEVRAGRTEQEVALAIDWRIRRGGFSRSAFETIVASGPRGALPHAQPTERILSEGDLVVLDFGGVYASYCVDLTRTVSIGKPTLRAREVYHAVLEAHDRAIASVRPGVSRLDIDAAARDTLGHYGLAEAFGHGTGHGLGLEVHEDPRITRRRPDVDTRDEAVAPGMVFTIEPGAYLPDWGGVRIEDDVLVTATGAEVLTDVTTELLEL
ncbi:MAG TPA: Xaa-Pro peptidase family protein [Vicinamibacterales bacterium]|nr:Xaa-Pro peptidase family protein [Vicinamibacterales bacterium]